MTTPDINRISKYQNLDVYESLDSSSFYKLLSTNQPAIINHIDFGFCSKIWTLDYLSEKLANTRITIHESDSSDLNFIEKNFKYQTCNFSDFASTLKSNYKKPITKFVYFRSVAQTNAFKKPADIETDFPDIAQDFKIPEYIPKQKIFSTILRIASNNVQVWTHFDLYDNLLHQIIGTRRVILFEPKHSEYLYVRNDKSRVNCLDDLESCINNFPLMSNVTFHQTTLMPGQSLYIPSCWWHNIRSSSCDKGVESIGLNIFLRDANIEKLYQKKDVFGNSNLSPVGDILSSIDNISEELKKLPKKYRYIYLAILFDRMKSNLEIN